MDERGSGKLDFDHAAGDPRRRPITGGRAEISRRSESSRERRWSCTPRSARSDGCWAALRRSSALCSAQSATTETWRCLPPRRTARIRRPGVRRRSRRPGSTRCGRACRRSSPGRPGPRWGRSRRRPATGRARFAASIRWSRLCQRNFGRGDHRDHPLAFSEGPGSPFARLHDLDSRILFVVLGFNRCTALHFAESLVARRRAMTVRFSRLEGARREWVEMPNVADDADTHFPVIGARYLTAGRATEATLGEAKAVYVRMQTGQRRPGLLDRVLWPDQRCARRVRSGPSWRLAYPRLRRTRPSRRHGGWGAVPTTGARNTSMVRRGSGDRVRSSAFA